MCLLHPVHCHALAAVIHIVRGQIDLMQRNKKNDIPKLSNLPMRDGLSQIEFVWDTRTPYPNEANAISCEGVDYHNRCLLHVNGMKGFNG